MNLTPIQKIAIECLDDFDAPQKIAKAFLERTVSSGDLTGYLRQRSVEKRNPGETIEQSFVRNFVDGDDYVGAQLYQLQRKYEVAFAGGRPDTDRVGREMFAKMIIDNSPIAKAAPRVSADDAGESMGRFMALSKEHAATDRVAERRDGQRAQTPIGNALWRRAKVSRAAA